MANKRGSTVYVQSIKDEHGFVVKQIVHHNPGGFKLKRKKQTLAKPYQK